MRNILPILAFALTAIAWSMPAQDNPTMEQTVSFIQDAFLKQGNFTAGQTLVKEQSITLESECSMLLKRTISVQQVDSKVYGVLQLRSSDIASLTIVPLQDGDQTWYRVELKQADFQLRLPAVVSEKKLLFHAGQPAMENNSAKGKFEAAKDGAISLVTEDGIRVSAPLDASAHALLWGYSPTTGVRYTPVPIEDLSLGEEIALGSGREKDKHGEFKTKGLKTIEDGTTEIILWSLKPKGRQPAIVGMFQDKDSAERVAKAYIHAMVLCHKDDKPSLF